jgi:hypothetical protein
MKIGLIGAPGAGKDDVVAHTLVKRHGFRRFAFADRIKEHYYKKIGITEEYFKSIRGTDREQEIRNGLWTFSDVRRAECGPLCFINDVINDAKLCQNAVITDIRTEDELTEVSKVADDIIIVIRDLDDILMRDDLYFHGTRIQSYKLGNLPTFFNIFGELEHGRESFEEFYQRNLEENNGS